MLNNSKISYNRIFKFGKYKGKSVVSVINSDIQYFEWMSSKMGWLFTDYEKQMARNMRSRLNNRDVNTINVKHRTPFEEEMYRLYNNLKKTYI